eukprot:scaffold59983_cov36-Tisochrysis_lutea.AAC.2
MKDLACMTPYETYRSYMSSAHGPTGVMRARWVQHSLAVMMKAGVPTHCVDKDGPQAPRIEGPRAKKAKG